ncbi:hypothetical protein [Mycobacterium noviomagense]|nr:hypothetical protein [Mycobacterium noviomagense]
MPASATETARLRTHAAGFTGLADKLDELRRTTAASDTDGRRSR